MPAPSPVLCSAPRAPRWSSRISADEALGDDVVGAAAVQVGHEGHAAGVVLAARGSYSHEVGVLGVRKMPPGLLSSLVFPFKVGTTSALQSL